MVEAKLRVEALENRSNNNPFYGNTLVKNVVEETFYHDKDERDDIAPCGVKCTLKVGNVVMDIFVNRHYFDHIDATDEYIAFFTIKDNTYELFVKFDNDNGICDIRLEEWLIAGDFEDGEDADNLYRIGDFTTYATILP